MSVGRFMWRTLVVLFILQANVFISQTISPNFFGQNAWMPDTIGSAAACSNPPCVLYGKLHKHWNNIKMSKAAVIRFGGIAPDKNRPTNFQYIKMIDSVRSKGMEPILQVPYHSGQYTAQQAANIVQYVNITKGKNIKYWIIGNEPDLDYGYTTAAQVAAYFRPFASAMKAVDPTILTIGPETAWYNAAIINGLTTPGGASDITGKDANGNFYCDIISFHFYPFNGTQTRAQVISKLVNAGGLSDNLNLLNTRLANCNAYHNRTGQYVLRSAITEANVNYQNSSTDNVYSNGANSFIGGQFVAEMFSVAMKRNVNFVTIWSVIEGNTTALNIGYIDSPTANKKSLFWHYKLMAENFKGAYAIGTTNNSNVKSFGSKDAQYIQVMILNQDQTNGFNYTVRLNTSAVTGTNPLKININANVSAEYSDYITDETTVLLTFDLQGVLVKKCTYSLAGHAALNLPPSCQTMGTLPITLSMFSAEANHDLVQLNWQTVSETNNANFTVQKSKDAIEFENMGIVSGAGTTHEIKNYALTDYSPYSGISYYRLKQTDLDGNSSFSEIKQVNFNALEFEPVVFPNPSDGSVMYIGVNNAGENIPRVFLSDLLGKRIETLSRQEANIVEVYPREKLSKGIYVIVIELNGKKSVKKVVVE